VANNSFIEPKVQSSFLQNKLGESIYSVILLFKPTYVIELGALGGYSSLCILQALTHIGRHSTLRSFDLFEDYPHNCVSLEKYRSNLALHAHLFDPDIVEHDVVKTDIMRSIRAILSSAEPDDSETVLLFVDISNTAQNLSEIFLHNINNYPILFEGGTKERDSVQWMTKYKKVPIKNLKELGFNYSVVDHMFPGLSLYCPL
jgi:hypothetical protein